MSLLSKIFGKTQSAPSTSSVEEVNPMLQIIRNNMKKCAVETIGKNRQINALTLRNQELTEELNHLQGEFARIISESFVPNNSEAKNDVDSIRLFLIKKDEKIETMFQQMNQMDLERQELREEIEQLMQEVDELTVRNSAIPVSMNSKCEGRLRELQESLDRCGAERERSQAAMIASSSKLVKQQELSMKIQGALEQQMNSVAENLNQCKKSLDLCNRRNLISDTLPALKQSFEDTRIELTECNEKHEKLHEINKSLEQHVQAMTRDRDSFTEQMKKQQKLLTDCKRQLETISDTEIGRLTEEIESKNREIKELNVMNRTLQSSLERVKNGTGMSKLEEKLKDCELEANENFYQTIAWMESEFNLSPADISLALVRVGSANDIQGVNELLDNYRRLIKQRDNATKRQ